jgi:NADH-quinone oxidoreductase subunit G
MADNEKQNDTVRLTIDGREVTVPKGTSLLDAARQEGTEIPHYCYHPGLSSPAQCRLCLVEVEGAPKPLPSCVTQAMDGQVVHTQSEVALGAREGVLEFYLVNHPLDCPICDQAGECKLQDYVHREGRKHGRGREPKRVFGRDDFGGDVLYYGDRCVMCTRCVRFMTEVEQDARLCVVERGDRSVIDTFFDEGLEGTNFSGNVVDICPVGALVSKDFLFKARAWDLDHTPSICPNCSQGCNIELHTRDNVIQRLKPRENLEVNGYWMCDYGRGSYEWINRGDRIEAPLMRKGDKLLAAGWQDVLSALAARLGEVSGPVQLVVSPFASNEDMAMARAVMEAAGGGAGVFRLPQAEDEIQLKGFPALARRRELAPNAAGARALGFEQVGDDSARGGLEQAAGHDGIVFVVGDALADQAPDFGGNAALYVYMGSHAPEAASRAHFVLPATTFAEQEGTFTNFQGRVQRFWPGLLPPGMARPPWLVLGALKADLTDEEFAVSASEAFDRMTRDVPAFAGLDYESIGTRGALLNEPVQLAGD